MSCQREVKRIVLFLGVLQNKRCIAFQGRSGWEARLFLPSLGTLAPGPWPLALSRVGGPSKTLQNRKKSKDTKTQAVWLRTQGYHGSGRLSRLA